MDAEHYPLVPIPRGQTSLVPVPDDPLVVVLDREDDFAARLWRMCLGLAVLLWLALIAIRLLRRERLELRCRAGYWQAMHQRSVAREAELELQVATLKAEIREWKRRVFGRRTETASAANPQMPQPNDAPSSRPVPRPRGQQPGSTGHGRRNHDHLPAREETRDLPEDQRCCSQCREPFEEIPGTADGVLLEIEVKAHRRVYHRKRYRRC